MKYQSVSVFFFNLLSDRDKKVLDFLKVTFFKKQINLELVEKRKLIVNELVELRDSVSPFIDLFEKEDVKKLLETDRLHLISLL
jgi:hypothetical protein